MTSVCREGKSHSSANLSKERQGMREKEREWRKGREKKERARTGAGLGAGFMSPAG